VDVEVVVVVDAGTSRVPVRSFNLAASLRSPPYQISRPTNSCDDLARGQIVADATGRDRVSAAIALPFPFQFLGETFDFWNVSTCGFLRFSNAREATTTCTGAPRALPSSAAPPGSLFPFWGALEVRAADGFDVRWATITTPSRHMTVQWSVNACCEDVRSTAVVQLKLFEATNVVEFHYCRLGAGGSLAGAGVVVGFQDPIGLVGGSVSTFQRIDPTRAFRFDP